jgi:hypothetical protein
MYLIEYCIGLSKNFIVYLGADSPISPFEKPGRKTHSNFSFGFQEVVI